MPHRQQGLMLDDHHSDTDTESDNTGYTQFLSLSLKTTNMDRKKKVVAGFRVTLKTTRLSYLKHRQQSF